MLKSLRIIFENKVKRKSVVLADFIAVSSICEITQVILIQKFIFVFIYCLLRAPILSYLYIINRRIQQIWHLADKQNASFHSCTVIMANN